MRKPKWASGLVISARAYGDSARSADVASAATRRVVTRRIITERLCGRVGGCLVLLRDFFELREESGKAGLLRIEDAPFILDGAARFLAAIAARLIGRRRFGRGLFGRGLIDWCMSARRYMSGRGDVRGVCVKGWLRRRRIDSRRDRVGRREGRFRTLCTRVPSGFRLDEGALVWRLERRLRFFRGRQLLDECAEVERTEHSHRAWRALARVPWVRRWRTIDWSGGGFGDGAGRRIMKSV